jgi:hypothetical protein
VSRDALARELLDLDPRSERYRVLKAARDFKSSWVTLAELIHQVEQMQKYADWGFDSLEQYCVEELRISPRTAQKLLKSFRFLQENEPDVVTQREEDPRDRPPIPDVAQVSFLARARTDQGLPEPVYRKLRDAAFRHGATVTELRSQLKEAVPVAAKPRPPRDAAQALRVALSHVARTLEVLSDVEGIDDEMIRAAERLRDLIAHRLPRSASPNSTAKQGAAGQA